MMAKLHLQEYEKVSNILRMCISITHVKQHVKAFHQIELEAILISTQLITLT